MKPVSTSTKDWIVSVISKDLEIEESICNTVISWSYLKAKEKTKDVKSIEFSGFGKLLISDNKTKKNIRKLEERIIHNTKQLKNPVLSHMQDSYINKINKATEEIGWLKTKLEDDGMEQNTGGMEK